MKKCILVYFFIYLWLARPVQSSGSIKKLSSSIPTLSSSRPVDFLIKGTVGVISLVGLLILKIYILSRYRRSKIKHLKEEFSWVRTNYDVENYPNEIPEVLLKCRRQLFSGFKDLLEQFQQEMGINDENFVNYLITEAEGEDYLQTNQNRKRFVDDKIPKKILNFINGALKQVHIEPTNVDVRSGKLKETEEGYEPAGTRSHIVSGNRSHEDLLIATRRLDRYENLFNNFALAFTEHNKLVSHKEKEEHGPKLFCSLVNLFREELKLYSNILHEVSHMLSHHTFINASTVDRSKNNSESFKIEFRRYQEYMADALLPLLYKKAAQEQLCNAITKNFNIDQEGKIVLNLFHENTDQSFYMSQKSNFILCTDIAKLHGICLKNCLPKKLEEMTIQSTLDSIYTNLENIYNSADPESYIQTYKKEDGTEETFKFPRFLPHLLEK